jgi:MarR family transcriptional regulator, organic hydroperoxide resistance regulator
MIFEETLPYLFTQLSTFYRVEIEKALNELDLHSGQIFILFELWKTDGLSQIELSSNLKVSAATINKMVKSLEKSGFVVNSQCPRDKRVMRVFLTLRGAAIRPQVEVKWQQLEQKILGDLTATEQLVLSQLFSKLTGNLLNKAIS